jgi:hypothetical protein
MRSEADKRRTMQKSERLERVGYMALLSSFDAFVVEILHTRWE